jgi:hypothetical protein
VIVDWGMARLGPSWVDPLLLALQKDPAAAAAAAVDLLAAFAGSQAWNARQPARPGLPSFAAYCAEDADRLFRALRLALSAGSGAGRR